MKLWSLIGNSQKLDGGAMFGNVPRPMWGKVANARSATIVSRSPVAACSSTGSTASACCSRPASARSSNRNSRSASASSRASMCCCNRSRARASAMRTSMRWCLAICISIMRAVCSLRTNRANRRSCCFRTRNTSSASECLGARDASACARPRVVHRRAAAAARSVSARLEIVDGEQSDDCSGDSVRFELQRRPHAGPVARAEHRRRRRRGVLLRPDPGPARGCTCP